MSNCYLESYLQDAEAVQTRLELIRLRIDNAEDLFGMKLDLARNRLITADTIFTLLGMVVGAGRHGRRLLRHEPAPGEVVLRHRLCGHCLGADAVNRVRLLVSGAVGDVRAGVIYLAVFPGRVDGVDGGASALAAFFVS